MVRKIGIGNSLKSVFSRFGQFEAKIANLMRFYLPGGLGIVWGEKMD